jgi:DNA-binding IclR family transcriptional regulator
VAVTHRSDHRDDSGRVNTAERNGGVDSALGKGLRVLEALALAGGPVRLSHLASDLEMQKSSVHRVLRSLTELGFVTQDPDTDLYTATLRLWELGTSVVNALPIKQVATTVLQELHRRTNETVSLVVRDGDDVLYLDKILSPRPMGFTTRVGSRAPAPLTAGGRAMLAAEPDATAAIERMAERLGDRLNVERLRDDIRRARDDGYLVATGHRDPRIIGFAAAVPAASGGALAALTVSAVESRLGEAKRQAIVDALLIAVSDLTEALGHRSAYGSL